MTTQNKNKILNIDRIIHDLIRADIYKDDDGNKLQTIYLGSILDITPSKKIYTIFARSNLNPCTKCNGEGVIRNKHGKRKKYENTRKKRTRLLRTYKKTQHNKNKEKKLWKQENQWKQTKTCPECDGLGSLEARLDRDWWKQLEIELNGINAWAHGSDGDGCDILISREAIEVNENDVN